MRHTHDGIVFDRRLNRWRVYVPHGRGYLTAWALTPGAAVVLRAHALTALAAGDPVCGGPWLRSAGGAL